MKVAERELQVIADDLGCSHVRITGADSKRIAAVARKAALAGLSIWFSPFPCNLTADELLHYFVDCAKKAEEIRLISPDTVFLLGCELSFFTAAFCPAIFPGKNGCFR